MDGLIVAAIVIAAIMLAVFFLGPVAYRHDRRVARRQGADDAGAAFLASGVVYGADGGSGCSDGGSAGSDGGGSC